MNSITVVGGGVVGIASAILLKKPNNTVYLIEQAESLGGLLKTITYDNEISFDFGTHIPRETGITELDDILFSHLNSDEWNSFNYLKVGNYFKDLLYKDSQFIYSPSLGKEVYTKGLSELIQTQPVDENVSDADTYLEKFYGDTFKTHIYAPLLKKLYEEELSELHPMAHKLFGYNRVICGNNFTSNMLKKSEFFDEKLAYNSYEQGISQFASYYPKKAGIEAWIHTLVEKAEEIGVEILKSTQIKSVKYEEGKVSELEFANMESIICDFLVWTIPSVHLMNACAIKLDEKPVKFRSVKLFNFVMDKPFLVDNHYIYCNDPKMKTYRVTLYPNLVASSGGQAPPYNCTIEVVGNYEELDKVQDQEIFLELVHMGIVSNDANLLSRNNVFLKNGFPIIKKEHFKKMNNIEVKVRQNIQNVLTLGNSNGQSFFLEDSLRSAYTKIKELNL